MENKLIFTNHIVNQMNNRNISLDNVKHVLATGVVIREYPEDLPFPSLLILGYCDKIPLHVVFSLKKY